MNHKKREKVQNFEKAEIDYWNEFLPLKDFFSSIGCEVQEKNGKYIITEPFEASKWSAWNTSHKEIAARIIHKNGTEGTSLLDIVDLVSNFISKIPKNEEEKKRDAMMMSYRPLSTSETIERAFAREFIRRTAFEKFQMIFEYNPTNSTAQKLAVA